MGFGQQLIRKFASSFLSMKHISCFLDPLQNNYSLYLFEFFHFKVSSFSSHFFYVIIFSIIVHILFGPVSSRIPTHLPFTGKKSLVMDPSIVKFFEEDEDESMHSGADVEAFQAALNRDIEGDASTSQPPESDTVLSQGSNRVSSQSLAQWPTVGQDGNANFQHQQPVQSVQQRSSEMEQKQQGVLVMGSLQQPNDVPQGVNRLPPQQKQPQDDHQQGVAEQVSAQVPLMAGIQTTERSPIPREPERTNIQDSESQYAKLQKMSNQQAGGTEQPNNQVNRGKQVPFAVLLPSLLPQLDKDRAMQLHTLYGKLKKNEIAKDGFVRHMRDIVGDQMLRLAVNKLQVQMSSNQVPLQSQVAARPNTPRMPSVGGATQFGGPHTLAQLHQKGPNSPANSSHPSPPAVLMQTNSSYLSIENKVQKSQEMDRQPDSHFGVLKSQNPSSSATTVIQERDRASIPVQGINMQQQHLNFAQTSFGMYGSSNYHTYSGSNVSNSGSCLKPQPHESQIRQIPHHQSMGSNPVGGPTQTMNMMGGPKLERQNSTNDPNRLQGGSISHFSSNSVSWQASSSKELNPGPLSSMTYVKQESVDQVVEQQHGLYLSAIHGSSTAIVEEGNSVNSTPKDEFLEKQSSRVGFSAPTSMAPPNLLSPSITTQMDSNLPVISSYEVHVYVSLLSFIIFPRSFYIYQLGSQSPSVPATAGVNGKAPQKRPCAGQKKPLEALGYSPPLSSKKQKVSGGFSDQSIEQLNDVTAVSGVNLRVRYFLEEEEQLFSVPKDESRVSEASRRIVQEEEERVILQKIPLQKKLAEIMAKSGLKNISNDVERFVSLCVEERMHGLLCNLIRLSKQRVDVEKPRHRTHVTSDVQQHIMMMNRNAREEWEKKQAEAEKLRKLNDPEAETTVDGDKEKDDGRVKVVKVLSMSNFPSIICPSAIQIMRVGNVQANKEEDDKMRATAANVAARAAVGGGDMLSKWQLMAEQARQKREGGTDSLSGCQAGKDVNCRPLSASGKNTGDYQESENRGSLSPPASGSSRKSGRNQGVSTHTRMARSISVKDVIAVLEREPQMSKSTLIYRLYEKARSEAAAK
ncbi:Transcription initiation factor TFIID subunit 4 [Gossypium australe]|uniref:Transcription initiation factor TFIID subunit 4 n=1 Tax=Gossypium australe TaxID=47621 RepID=A0A5B6VCL3_9ROSI|nr:Transcription initiation factor TFIID subunit 4 [Gossypium australe]